MEISFITTEQTYPLRQNILRPGKPLQSVFLDKDDHPDSFHIGAISENKIISVVTFHRSNHADFIESQQYQLRKMATDPDFRTLGAGRKVVEKGIRELENRKAELIWCNARAVAIGFYEKLGFKVSSDFFEVPQIGLHKLMYFRLI